MRAWKRKGYMVVEKHFDHDLHKFEVVKFKIVNEDESIATIIPNDIDDMDRIINDLDNGEDVDGWEDGMGNTISVDIE